MHPGSCNVFLLLLLLHFNVVFFTFFFVKISVLKRTANGNIN